MIRKHPDPFKGSSMSQEEYTARYKAFNQLVGKTIKRVSLMHPPKPPEDLRQDVEVESEDGCSGMWIKGLDEETPDNHLKLEFTDGTSLVLVGGTYSDWLALDEHNHEVQVARPYIETHDAVPPAWEAREAWDTPITKQ
jgi:hypothetical protein